MTTRIRLVRLLVVAPLLLLAGCATRPVNPLESPDFQRLVKDGGVRIVSDKPGATPASN